MPPPHRLLSHDPARVAHALQRLQGRVWQRLQPLSVTATAPTAEHHSRAAIRRAPRQPITPGDTWGRLFDQRWFHLRLPRLPSQQPLYLEWRDQGEATLHTTDGPWHGLDVAHPRAPLPENVRELWIEAYCCQTAIWHPAATGLSPQGSRFDGAFLVARDDQAWSLWHDLQVLFDLLMHLRARELPHAPAALHAFGPPPSVEHVSPQFRRLLRSLDDAINTFDSAGPAALQKSLRRIYAELRDPRSPFRATLTGHAHIDLVWLWPERMSEAKTVHTFATVNRLMATYPEFRFAFSQPAAYRAVARRSPSLAQAVQTRLKSGQWQATGAMEVESDTLLPCGEALLRSFQLGQAEFRRLTGRSSPLLWLPDVFGYSACLPQLMALTGVKYFFTTKLSWNGVNRFPHSSFIWRGPDGSEVLAHVSLDTGYNNTVALAEIDAHARGYAQADVWPEVLHPTGYGDGGGGPTAEMCERARRLSRLAGTPELTWDHPEAFFDRLARRRSQLPVWTGECYLEYHRGTYTTRATFKATFRALERALQFREAVAAATGEAPDLLAAWRRAVFAQFHDAIPGSSIPPVYAELQPELAALTTTLQQAGRERLASPASTDSLHVFNPLPLPWSGWVRRTPRSRSQWMQVPPLQAVPLTAAPSPSPATARGRTLDNGLVRAVLDARGRLIRLRVRGRDVDFAGPAAELMLAPDHPVRFEAWDIDRAAIDQLRPVLSPATLRLDQQPDRAVITVSRSIGAASRLDLSYVLVAGETVLRLEIDLDWQEPRHLLQLHFPTVYRGQNARFGAPFGSVLRPQLSGSSIVAAQWEVPASRWATVSDDGERTGLALITEAKYGFSARDGRLTVSLVRSPTVVGRDQHRAHAPLDLARDPVGPDCSDLGRHRIQLALTTYDAEAPTAAQPAALADTLFAAPLVLPGNAVAAGFNGLEDAPSLIPAWAQPIDAKTWILRCHEVGGRRGRARLNVAAGWRACRCDVDGRPIGAPANDPFDYGPNSILSFRFENVGAPA